MEPSSTSIENGYFQSFFHQILIIILGQLNLYEASMSNGKSLGRHLCDPNGITFKALEINFERTCQEEKEISSHGFGPRF